MTPKLPAETFGKFDTDQGLRLGVTGEPYYRTHVTPQGTLLRGPGSRAPVPLGPDPSTVAATLIPVGDSNTSRSHQAANGQATGIGYVPWVQLLTHERLTLVRNAGAAGEGVEAVDNRLDSDVLVHAPGFVIYVVGVNDVKGLSSAAGTIRIMGQTFDRLRDAGAFVLAGTVLPSDLIDTTAEKDKLSEVNAWLRNTASRRPGLRVVDIAALVTDPAAVYSSGAVGWASGLTDDGTHSNTKSAKIIGRAFADAINLLVPRQSPLPAPADPGELLPNPMMTGNAAGLATGAAVATFSGTAPTPSKVARTDIPGEWQRVVGSASSSWKLQQTATTGFAGGDTVVATLEVEESGSFANEHGLLIEAWSSVAFLGSTGVSGMGAETLNGVLRTRPFTVPAGTVSLRTYYRATHPAGSGGTVDIGRFSLRKV